MELRDRARHLNEILDLERAPLEKGIFDNTFWDDMVAFVRHPRPEWAKENIENGFPLFGVQFVWVYDPALTQRYAMSSSAGDPDTARLPPAALRAALDDGWFRHFFAPNAEHELFGKSVRSFQTWTDAPATQWHRWYDWNFHVEPEPPFAWLRGVGNLSRPGSITGNEAFVIPGDTMECELDMGAFGARQRPGPIFDMR